MIEVTGPRNLINNNIAAVTAPTVRSPSRTVTNPTVSPETMSTKSAAVTLICREIMDMRAKNPFSTTSQEASWMLSCMTFSMR